MNDILVSENDLNLLDSSLRIVLTVENTKNTYNCFRDEANCMLWLHSKQGGDQVIDVLEKGKHLAHFADSIGAIAQFEKNGTLMPEYVKHEKEVLQKAVPGNKVLGAWHKNYGSGPNFPAVSKPFFGSSWNNVISSVSYVGPITVYYDKTFYKTHLLTIWHITTGNFYFSFYNMYVDNKTTSAIAQ